MNDVKWGWKKATAIFSAIVISGACLGAATTAMAGTQGGESVEDLRAMINQLKNTVVALEQKMAIIEDNQEAADKTIKEVAAKESVSGSNLLLPENTTMKIYGYAKLDAVYTDTGGTYEYAYVPSSVPLDSANVPDNSFVMHAKQTRIGFATSTDTDYGKFNTKIECDFYGGGGNEWVSNSWGLRLRRAYGELGNLRAGQDWSTFIDLGAYPETLDFGGAAGSLFIRQAVVRWTQPFEGGSFMFALENPEAKFQTADLDDTGNLIYGSDSTVSGNNEYMPDFIARVNFNPGGIGKYSIVGLARQFSYDDGVTDDTEWGAAISANAVISTFGQDNFHININYGNGLGRYMESEFQDAFIDPISGDIETNEQIGGFLSYQHYWLNNLRSTLVYSYAERDNDTDYVSEAVDESYQSVHANIIWSPVSRVNVGMEYIWGYREIEDGEDGDMNRLMCSFQYNF